MYTTCSELVVFMYWTGKSMNNLLSYCGLVDARISAFEKDLPVPIHHCLKHYHMGLLTLTKCYWGAADLPEFFHHSDIVSCFNFHIK
jgi:hypothetical protein